MTVRILPGRAALLTLALATLSILVALVAGMAVGTAGRLAAAAIVGLGAATAWDYFASVRAWRESSPRLTRRLPAAFAVGVRKRIDLFIDVGGVRSWKCELYDHADGSLLTEGLPMVLTLMPGTRLETAYTVLPTMRGEVAFEAADLRIRSGWGLCELRERLGPRDGRRVYPDFAQVARYAWLAGDRRLQEIGVKTYHLRGQGTDFKQLSEYRVGDSVRHIDWRATSRVGKPIVREFQDERDQYVMLLVDCGRRMRAHDQHGGVRTSHFDQVLNALMLLAYVALDQGDAVGALTFGTPPERERAFPPRKGSRTLNALMSQLYGVQPTATHSDYLAAARALLRMQQKRALVIIITNFRDEDSPELRHALRLLRTRHLVLLASLRERIVGDLMTQPLGAPDAAIEIASAHLYEQSRREAFNRLAARDGLMVDADPDRLGIELVNRYRAMKRSGAF